MRILVTGSEGFIGQWVMRELEKTEYAASGFRGDVRDKSTFPKEPFDAVIHLAALIPHRQRHTSDDLYEVNVQGTKNLLEAFPYSKIIFISTTDVTRDELTEYAQTKLEAERIVSARRNSLIIRLPSVFGPNQRQKKLIPLLFEKYCNNEPCKIINNELKEYIYVEDAAQQIVAKMDKKGIVRIEGFKIRNLDLDVIIRAICKGDEIPKQSFEYQKLINQLNRCLPQYEEKKTL